MDLSILSPSSRMRQLPPPFDVSPTYYFPFARNAIYHGLRALGVSPGDTILVPSFHCATVVEPIISYGANVKFFNIRRDLSPDFSDIEAKIDSKVRAVLAIHYFGFPQPIQRLMDLCRAHHLYLIEDCAHVLTGKVNGTTLGTVADISIFSWRKFLPLFDGGQLVINNPKLHIDIPWQGNYRPLSLGKVYRKIIVDLIDGSAVSKIKGISRLFLLPCSIGRRLFPESKRPRQVFDLSLVDLRMSRLSRYILRNADIPAILKKRRSNSIFLIKALESMPEITPVFPDLQKGICPWLLPVLIDGGQDFRERLRSSGVHALMWHRIFHHTLRLEEFAEASFLYQNMVLLPVHQSINNLEMQTIIEAIKGILLSEK